MVPVVLCSPSRSASIHLQPMLYGADNQWLNPILEVRQEARLPLHVQSRIDESLLSLVEIYGYTFVLVVFISYLNFETVKFAVSFQYVDCGFQCFDTNLVFWPADLFETSFPVTRKQCVSNLVICSAALVQDI